MQPDNLSTGVGYHFMLTLKQCFFNKTFFILLAGYLSLLLILDIGGGDIWLASQFYAFEGYQWALKDHWLAEEILHKGARKFNYLLAMAVLITTLYYTLLQKTKPQLSNAYLALTLSLICSFALVAYLKAITNIACPWSLAMFGGSEPYIHILQPRPSYLPYSQCFPAGHASVGYAWVALYYFFRATKPEFRWLGLSAGVLAGLVLGFTQQLRGAHFFSHDLTTLFLCICSARFCFALYDIRAKQQPSQPVI